MIKKSEPNTNHEKETRKKDIQRSAGSFGFFEKTCHVRGRIKKIKQLHSQIKINSPHCSLNESGSFSIIQKIFPKMNTKLLA